MNQKGDSSKFDLALKVVAKDGEGIDQLLKRFKRKLKYSGRYIEIRKHDYYVKKSELRRQKKRRRKLTDGRLIKD